MKVSSVGSMVVEGRSRVDGSTQQRLQSRGKYLLLVVWLSLGLLPVILQLRSFVQLVAPHQIALHLIDPASSTRGIVDLSKLCPVKEFYIADVYWNIMPTHYFTLEKGQLCHFAVPQYNVHGVYFLETKHSEPSPNMQGDCEDDSFPLSYFLYHGSVGYYAFYEEGTGSYCAKDERGYLLVTGLGSFDTNGPALAANQATTGCHSSYWYGVLGSVWIAYRFILLRRSFILCKRHSRRCENAQHTICLADAIVFVQESMRISPHHITNYHRLIMVYILVEGIMSELFMLIALEGIMGRLHYLSLGYNLSGLLSLLFEMIEHSRCLGERCRCCLKRLLFNYETVLIGELVCAASLENYLTSLNRTSLRDTHPETKILSYYVWSLVGHGCIVLSFILALVFVRALGALVYVQWRHGTLAVLTASCCIDTILGERCKLILLAGYAYEDGVLYYKSRTLAAFGIARLLGDDGSEYLAFHKLQWTAPSTDLVVIAIVRSDHATPCGERRCEGFVSMFDRKLGGSIGGGTSRRRLASNKVSSGPSTRDLLQVT